jgi:hypothetical protein
MNPQTKYKMIEKKESIGAWKNQTKDGKEVIKFSINGQRYNMWVNSYKDKPAQPDYKIYEDNYVAPTETKLANDDLEF